MAGLIALAGACNYDNPGFKIKDTDTSVSAGPSGVMTGDDSSEPMLTTTTPTSTDSTMTGVGPQVSGNESDSTNPTPDTSSSDTGDATTAEGPPWDNSCDPNEWVSSAPVKAAADAFFVFQGDDIGGKGCDIGLPDPLEGDSKCVNRSAGAMKDHPLVYIDGGDPNPFETNDDTIVVFGARFDVPKLQYMGETVPKEAFAEATFVVTVFRGTEALPMLDVYPSGPGDAWPDGGNDSFSPCMPGQASFRCRICGDTSAGTCTGWDNGTVFDAEQAGPIGELVPMVQKGQAAPVSLTLDTMKLDRAFEGLVVVPRPSLGVAGNFQVRSNEYGQGEAGPTLTIKFCPKPTP